MSNFYKYMYCYIVQSILLISIINDKVTTYFSGVKPAEVSIREATYVMCVCLSLLAIGIIDTLHDTRNKP